MMSTTTTMASAFGTPTTLSHACGVDKSGASEASTASSLSLVTSSTSSSSPPRRADLPSLRSQSKLREILSSDHERRDVKVRSALHQRQDNQQDREQQHGLRLALPLSATPEVRAQMADSTGAAQINEAEQIRAIQAVDTNFSRLAIREGASTPNRHIESHVQGAGAAPDASQAVSNTQHISRRSEAPPLYSSKSSPLLERHTSAIDVIGHGATSYASAMQRQRSLRQALERQTHSPPAPIHARTDSKLASSALIPTLNGSAAAVTTPSGQTSFDSAHVTNMHRQRSAGTNFDAKVVVLGSQGVGKTSLLHRYTSGMFSNSAMPSTIGASFLTKKLLIDGIKVRLQLWDTAGQERFRSMAPMYYRGANAAVIVYDITSPTSFDDVKSWIDELRQNVHSDLIIHVVGSKADLAPEHRHVDIEQARMAVASWTRPTPPSPGECESPSRVPTSLFGRRRGLPASPPSSTQHRSSVPATSISTSRLHGLSALVGMGSKSGASREDAFNESASDPSSGNGSAHDGNVNVQPGADAFAAAPSDLWDFIEVTEVSAKDNEGVEDVFSAVATRLVERREQLQAEDEQRKLRQRQSVFLTEQDFDQGSSRDRRNERMSWCCSS